MTTPKDILGNLSAGRVLDVATGSGGFIHFLVEGLQGYTEIIGVDTNERAGENFTESFKNTPNIRFQKMDALQLDFADSSFDMVCISNSLHHLDPQAALRQMRRVLRPGGTLLASEMYRDGQTEAQLTHVELHHWWAAVDRIHGVAHRETYRRGELVELVAGLGLTEMRLFDLSDLNGDPKNPEIMEELNPVFDRYLQRADGYPELQARGEELRRRVGEVGFQSATTLVALAKN